MITAAVATCIVALVLVATLTAHAWRDWHRHPDRYGYRPGERVYRLTRTQRGVTRQAVGRHWPRPWIRR